MVYSKVLDDRNLTFAGLPRSTCSSELPAKNPFLGSRTSMLDVLDGLLIDFCPPKIVKTLRFSVKNR